MDIFEECGGDKWVDILKINLDITKTIFRDKLKSTTTNVPKLLEYQNELKKLRDCEDDEINKIFNSLKKEESDIHTFLKKEEEFEKEGKGQIVFTAEWSKPLNSIPYLLPAAAIFKMYIFPFFAVVIPLLSWILPWIIIRIFFGMPMPFETYKNMILDMWLGGTPWAQMDFWRQMRVVFQSAWTAFGLFQSVHQPIQQALHVQKIHTTIQEHGYNLWYFLDSCAMVFSRFSRILDKKIESSLLNEIPRSDPLMTYAYVRDHPKDLEWILRQVGELELQWRLAKSSDLCFTEFSKSRVLAMNEFFDPNIPEGVRVKSNLCMKDKNHALLTGPNQGGKSSSLRAILLNVWLSQTLGVAFAKNANICPFTWIRSGLRLADKPGEKSLFEREILFSKDTLKLAKSGKPGLVLYDECFHSTNPPDGEKTAQIFLTHLWSSQSTISIISSHVFSLVDNAPVTIEKLCVPAEKTENSIKYSFTLSPGVCKVSSVEEIYKKYRFPMTAYKALV